MARCWVGCTDDDMDEHEYISRLMRYDIHFAKMKFQMLLESILFIVPHSHTLWEIVLGYKVSSFAQFIILWLPAHGFPRCFLFSDSFVTVLKSLIGLFANF